MRKQIHCQVAGMHARSDCHLAGVRGSANAMTILAEFGSPWELCESITATFTDANGENPNVIPLVGGESEFANQLTETLWAFAVPSSATAVAGTIEMVFDGVVPEGVEEAATDTDVVIPDEADESETEDESVTITGPVRLRAVETYEIRDAQETVTDEWGAAQPTEVEKLLAELKRCVGNAAEILDLNSYPPKIADGYWYIYNTAKGTYEQAAKAQGEKGEKGDASGVLTTNSVGEDELQDSSITEAKLSADLRAAVLRRYAQLEFYSGQRQKVSKDGTYRLWFNAGDVMTNDTTASYFAVSTDTDDSNYRYLLIKQDMTARISAQLALTLGSSSSAAAGGIRSAHVIKVDSSGDEETLARATIQDWSKTKGRGYTISTAPKMVTLEAGDRLKLAAYMKKGDSVNVNMTWLLVELEGVAE